MHCGNTLKCSGKLAANVERRKCINRNAHSLLLRAVYGVLAFDFYKMVKLTSCRLSCYNKNNKSRSERPKKIGVQNGFFEVLYT